MTSVANNGVPYTAPVQVLTKSYAIPLVIDALLSGKRFVATEQGVADCIGGSGGHGGNGGGEGGGGEGGGGANTVL